MVSPHTFVTCRARAWIENIRLGVWALEVQYDPSTADEWRRRGVHCNTPQVTRPAIIRARCSDRVGEPMIVPVVVTSVVYTHSLVGAEAALAFGHERDLLAAVADHMWQRMHATAARVRRHALMLDVANLTNAGFLAHARELRGWLLKIKLDTPARTA